MKASSLTHLSSVRTYSANLGCRSRIDHAVDVLLHRRLLDALEVVAHAHVEAERLGFAVLPRVEDLFQQVQRKPGLQVFIEGLGQRVLGRPLGVVALVLGVDAGLGDLQAVHDLHRLQLDEAATRQPRDDDVLRQLRVRPGGRADRRLAGFAEHLDQAVVGLAIELGLGDVEDRPAGLVLAEDSRQQSFEGNGTHDVAHRDLLVANGAGRAAPLRSSSADGAPAAVGRRRVGLPVSRRPSAGAPCVPCHPIRVPVRPSMPSLALASRVISVERPGLDAAKSTAACTLGSIEPLAKWPSPM